MAIYLPELLFRLRLRRTAVLLNEFRYRGTPEADKFLEHFAVCRECSQRDLPGIFSIWHVSCREFVKWDRTVTARMESQFDTPDKKAA